MSSNISKILGWEAVGKVFGGKPPRAPTAITPPVEVDQKNADIARDDLLKRLSKLRRATQTSELTAANVKRRTLGAGGLV
jgi:hypothetical protein